MARKMPISRSRGNSRKMMPIGDFESRRGKLTLKEAMRIEERNYGLRAEEMEEEQIYLTQYLSRG